MRTWPSLLTVLLSALGAANSTVYMRAADPPSALFASYDLLEASLEAPLADLIERSRKDEDYSVKGTLTYTDPQSRRQVQVKDVTIATRGHTSRRETECDFPKLKLTFNNPDHEKTLFSDDTVKVGAHCGDKADGELTPKYGRWPNEKAVHREAFIYRLLEALQVPALKARPARITYVFAGRGGEPLTRNAMFLEDDDVAIKRLGGTGQVAEEDFTSARQTFAPADTAKLAFANAMIGNFDWCLRMFPGDTFRCNDTNPLWNMIAVLRPGARALPVMQDFDLAGMVTGRHIWFKDVLNAKFASSEAEVEVLAQVQRTRTLFTRAELDATRQAFVARKAYAHDTVAQSLMDEQGRELARRYLDSFFGAIESEEAFYRPVVVADNAAIYTDAARRQPVCGGSIPPGTPVAADGEESGDMSRVLVLDSLWHFPRNCAAVRTQPVWIQTSAIGTDFPR